MSDCTAPEPTWLKALLNDPGNDDLLLFDWDLNRLSEAYFGDCAASALCRIVMAGAMHTATLMFDDLRIESPIEELMLAALLIKAADDGVAYDIMTWLPNDGSRRKYSSGDMGNNSRLLIWPQATINEYRVDFILSTKNGWHDRQLIEAGLKPSTWPKLIVECDGHDFHEKTKKQAARDKRRDRALASSGAHLFHFTGSELWKAPLQCAGQCLDWLSEESQRRTNIALKQAADGSPS